jgi:tripartite-type tricarboxylate transporter receptor subunit TctC
MPNLPTVAEQGFPGFVALNWYSFNAPGKTPTALLDPSIREQLNKHGLSPHPTSRTELLEFMRKESAKWGQIVRDRKILAE